MKAAAKGQARINGKRLFVWSRCGFFPRRVGPKRAGYFLGMKIFRQALKQALVFCLLLDELPVV